MDTWIVADVGGAAASSLDWKLIFSILIPGALVIASWFAAHWLTSKREFQARRREARVKGLEAAYMRVATSSNRDMNEEIMEKLETFVSEIQLYGTPKQVQLAGQMIEDYKAKKPVVLYEEILTNLRDALRKELQLESISTGIWWVRFERSKSGIQPQPSVSTSKKSTGAAEGV